MIIKRDRIDSDYSDYKEEYAAEVAPQRIDYDYDDKDDKDVVKSSVCWIDCWFYRSCAIYLIAIYISNTIWSCFCFTRYLRL